jgi:lysophospholipase L1-like esterase
MKKTLPCIVLLAILSVIPSFRLQAQSNLVGNLKAGRGQTLVVYGTSIAAMGFGRLWVSEVANDLQRRFGNKITVYNCAKAGQNSNWALKNLQDSVLSKNPNTVIIEFATNDAVDKFAITPEQCRLNTGKLIALIREKLPECEIILHTPCSFPIGEAAEKRPHLDQYRNVYKDIAREKHLILIDETEMWRGIIEKEGETVFRKYSGDGVHPTKKGALEVIYPAVMKALLTGK